MLDKGKNSRGLPRGYMRSPGDAVEVPKPMAALRIQEPAGLHRWISAVQATLVSGQAQPVLVLRAGPQTGIADREFPPASADEDE